MLHLVAITRKVALYSVLKQIAKAFPSAMYGDDATRLLRNSFSLNTLHFDSFYSLALQLFHWSRNHAKIPVT